MWSTCIVTIFIEPTATSGRTWHLVGYFVLDLTSATWLEAFLRVLLE